MLRDLFKRGNKKEKKILLRNFFVRIIITEQKNCKKCQFHRKDKKYQISDYI